MKPNERAERAEAAIKVVRELVTAWHVSDEQLAAAWLDPGDSASDTATMVLMAKTVNALGDQILEVLGDIAKPGTA